MRGRGIGNVVTDRFDYVFWAGDLNYRINGNRKMIQSLVEMKMREVLLANDQLSAEMRAGRCFSGFNEAEITFPPTYKFDTGGKESLIYDTSPKQRIPSWTDRILFKCRAPRAIKAINYTSDMRISMSDHKPVSGTFEIAFAWDSLPGGVSMVSLKTKQRCSWFF